MHTSLRRPLGPPSARQRLGLVDAPSQIYAAAVAVGLLHAVDDALLHRQAGVPLAQHLPALLAVTVTGVASVLVFPRLRAGLQSALALLAGVLTGTNGAMHVLTVVGEGPGGSDLTGLLAAVAGIVMVGLAVAVPYLRRGEGNRSRPRRWVVRVAATAAGAVAAQMLLLPLAIGLVQTHKFREPTGAPPSAAYQDVVFTSSDGLQLSGWYAPSRNRAAVLVVNSAGGDRNGSVRHAELLASHGYGVLLYDARGTGRSEGTPNGWGWDWDRDVAGALDFLRERPDVDAARIGGLGLSTGADVLVEVAAEQHGLAAVVADGATGRSFGDRPPGVAAAPFSWAMFAAGQLFSGTSPGRPLAELMAETAPTPMLLVAGGSLPSERWANARYARAGGEHVELWDLPDVAHNAGIWQRKDDYERRVVGLFDRELVAATLTTTG